MGFLHKSHVNCFISDFNTNLCSFRIFTESLAEDKGKFVSVLN
jgi:hypothetical protein